LESRASVTATFVWNTTGFARGNYTVSIWATPVVGETITDDNIIEGLWMSISISGDVARWLVPKMVKNGYKSVFAYLSP
jgi:hypothetical protein